MITVQGEPMNEVQDRIQKFLKDLPYMAPEIREERMYAEVLWPSLAQINLLTATIAGLEQEYRKLVVVHKGLALFKLAVEEAICAKLTTEAAAEFRTTLNEAIQEWSEA